jgi:hypothetical protein
MSTPTFEAREVVQKMERNAEHNVSNLCDWNNMTSTEQVSIYQAFQNNRSDLPALEITYNNGYVLKEKPGLVCEGGKKLPEAQAHDTVEGLRKNAAHPKETIAAVNKIQPEEQRQLVLKEMSEKGFPGVVIEKHNSSRVEYSITEDRSKAHAEALKYKSTGEFDKPKEVIEAEKQAMAKEKATGIVDTAQDAFIKPWLPLPENKRLTVEADQAEGELHRKIANLRHDPNRENVLAQLEKQGATISRDEQGRPIEITFKRQPDGRDPFSSVADKAAKFTIPLDKSFEEMKAEVKDEFYSGNSGLKRYGVISRYAEQREAQKETSRKFWFER